MGIADGLASGYHGPPALTVAGAFSEWTIDPPVLVLVLLLGGGYVAAARRAGDWPVARRIWFLGLGLGFLVIATMSFIGVYQHVLFFARAIQTVLLVLVAPLFLALGRPVSLFITVFPARGNTLQADQVIGGGALWILGDLVGLPFLAAQLIQLMREDESDAARIDADLDARDAALQTTVAAGEEPAGDDASRPWWEDDPRFTSRFKPT
jgi:cytochrome c oxidase assembly factor CtaG